MVDGAWCAAEERIGGWTAGQISGDHVRVARMLADASQHLASLVTRPPQAFTESDLEHLIGQRIRRVESKAVEPETIAALREMESVARAGLVGATFPLVRSHGDLRGKHVQVDEDGSVRGYLDWGATEAEDLPLFDLLHLIINEHKQETQLTIGEAWRLLEGDQSGLRAHESEALRAYSTALDLPPMVLRAIERLYPLLVADAAEKSWDYSRPRWVRRQFGL